MYEMFREQYRNSLFHFIVEPILIAKPHFDSTSCISYILFIWQSILETLGRLHFDDITLIFARINSLFQCHYFRAVGVLLQIFAI